MHHDARAYLWDVQKAADAILTFIAGMTVQTYAETEVVHSAVERKFEIIGEALNLDISRRLPLAGQTTRGDDLAAWPPVLPPGP